MFSSHLQTRQCSLIKLYILKITHSYKDNKIVHIYFQQVE
jgi:hypothetical protein